MINNLLLDSEIFELLKQNNNIVWNFIHAKYSTMMYSGILQFTDNKVIADEILKNTFAKLQANKDLIQHNAALGLSLLKHSCETATEFLFNSTKV
jgi:nitrate/TMAO reductase-like tetraheme cytochrome c subunit